MFTEPTVFILGAGASWHYGYPTGSALITRTRELADELRTFATNSNYKNQEVPQYFEHNPTSWDQINSFWETLGNDCTRFIEKIDSSDPLVIDYFLQQNPSLEYIGRFLITGVITQCAIQQRKSKFNLNDSSVIHREGNWLKFITAKLFSECKTSKDLLSNKVDFVTFNYDLSLEQHLYNALDSTDFIEKEDILEFFDNRIHHLYGKINWDYKRNIELSEYRSENQNLQKNYDQKRNFEFYHKCLEGLRIIAPDHKTVTCDETKSSIRKIRNAKNIYILGYGFDPMNSRKLQLSELKNTGKRIYFTNMDDTNTVNKKAGQLLYNDITAFLPFNSPIKGYHDNPPYLEKSTRSVYGALEKDFPL